MTHIPPRRRGFLRALTWFLSLVMVPVVIVTMPSVSQAATFSDPASAQIDWRWAGSNYTSVWESVAFSAYWVDDPSVLSPEPFIRVKSGTFIIGNGTDAMGAPDCDTDDCSSITLTFNGEGCSLSGAATVTRDWKFTGLEAAGTGIDDSCNVGEVCGELHIYRNNMADSDRASVCAPIELGPPPGPPDTPQTCAYGSVSQPIGRVVGAPFWDGGGWRINVEAKLDFALTQGGTWQVLVYKKEQLPAEGSYWSFNTNYPNHGYFTTSASGTYTYTANWPTNYNNYNNGVYAGPELSRFRPAGFMVYGPPGGENNQQRTPGPNGETWSSYGSLGKTSAGTCDFWFGQKVLNSATPSHVWDEPAGAALDAPPDNAGTTTEPEPVETPPVPPVPDSACTFSISDPTTWLEGGMCSAVGWLQYIWAALTEVVSQLVGLPGKIAGLIGSLLEGLLMPEAGYLDAKVSTTRAALDDTAPAQWVGAFDNLTPGAVQGCEGILVEPPRPDGAGVMFSERLGAACSGGMASAAALFKIAISAGLVIGGGLACIRALGSGFGWNPGVGQGGQQA